MVSRWHERGTQTRGPDPIGLGSPPRLLNGQARCSLAATVRRSLTERFSAMGMDRLSEELLPIPARAEAGGTTDRGQDLSRGRRPAHYVLTTVRAGGTRRADSRRLIGASLGNTNCGSSTGDRPKTNKRATTPGGSTPMVFGSREDHPNHRARLPHEGRGEERLDVLVSMNPAETPLDLTTSCPFRHRTWVVAARNWADHPRH